MSRRFQVNFPVNKGNKDPTAPVKKTTIMMKGDRIRVGEECRGDRNDWSAGDIANTSSCLCHRENLIIHRRPRSVMHRFHPQKRYSVLQKAANKDDMILIVVAIHASEICTHCIKLLVQLKSTLYN
ncbi:unnamed protein product [Lactuca saligna]|uniref:Uncharacterized protein n=1 Tax=Lactuca saligna TaxID=75948 RepID=A0AA35ZS49_LACSI|nr:unnamed protein product [Lactuca saligna]